MNHIRTFLLGAAAFLGVQSAFAVASYPDLLTMTQPDGSTVKVRIVGDEFGSAILTEDGYLLKEVNRAYYYANLDEQGRYVSSGILAGEPSRRSVKAQEFLKGVDMDGTVMPALERRNAEMRTFAKSKSGEIRPEVFTTGAGVGLFPYSKFPTSGKIKALVLLVDFPDQPFTLGDKAHDYFSRLLNEPGFSDYNATGSAADWFRDNSNGQFDPEFDVFGPVTLPHEMAYYGAHDGSRNDIRPQRMIIDACEILDPEVDFSQYDLDGDGIVDNVFVFYSGLSEAAGGTADTIWPHSWDITTVDTENKYIHDGVQLDHYACTNEWHYAENIPDGIGTFVHEFSHVMGLPDLYSTRTQFSQFVTPNQWDTMDRGNYNNLSRTPPCYSIFERYALGWLEPMEVTRGLDVRLKPIEDTNTGLRISTGSVLEYFLLENRQQTGWDAYIPGHGMLIWHIDYDAAVWRSNIVNDTQTRQRVDIEEACNNTGASYRAGVPFPGEKNVTEFTDYTRPSMMNWSNVPTNKPVTDIAESEDGIITFQVMGGGKVFESPKAVASDITHTGATISWTHQTGASTYEVSVFTTRGSQRDYLEGYKHLDVGCNTSFRIEGLQPQTEYYVEVFAASDYTVSDPSDAVKVKTTKAGFANFAPEAVEATEITGKSFTANWKEMIDAVDYRINVYTKALGEPNNVVLDFADGLIGLPAGWATSATATYSQASFSGAAVPSLRFSASDHFLESPRYPQDIRGLSFWSRGVSAKGKGTVRIMGLVNNAWQLLDSYVPTDDKGGETYSLDTELLPEGVRAIRLSYTADGGANIAIDDVVINWGGEDVVTNHPVYTAFATGNQTSLRAAESIDQLTTYYYTVNGVHADGTVSRPSNEVMVTTSDLSGIETVDNSASNFRVNVIGNTLIFVGADSSVTVTTPAGAAFTTTAPRATVARGIYLVTSGGKTVKVVVR